MHKRSKDHSCPEHSLLILPVIPHLHVVLKAQLLFYVLKLANLRIHFIITLKFFPCKCVLALSVLGTSGGTVGLGAERSRVRFPIVPL